MHGDQMPTSSACTSYSDISGTCSIEPWYWPYEMPGIQASGCSGRFVSAGKFSYLDSIRVISVNLYLCPTGGFLRMRKAWRRSAEVLSIMLSVWIRIIMGCALFILQNYLHLIERMFMKRKCTDHFMIVRSHVMVSSSMNAARSMWWFTLTTTERLGKDNRLYGDKPLLCNYISIAHIPDVEDIGMDPGELRIMLI